MKTDYDVIIIGAGPAGASCAKHLVDNGVKTLIIEKRELPRYKCCSGLLSDRSVNFIKFFFGEIPKEVICDNKDIKFKFSKTCISFVEDEKTKMLKTYRKQLDYWLLKKSNSDIINNCLFNNIKEINNKFKVYCKKNQKILEFTCKILIGADGGNSTLRKIIDPKFKDIDKIFALQNIYKGKLNIEKNYLYYLTSKKYSQKFAWFNFEDDLIYIGTSYFMKNKVNDYMTNILDILKKNYNLSDIIKIRSEGCFVDPRQEESKFFFGKKNVLLIGEAAGLINNYYEGISTALITGNIAAKSIINFLKSNRNLLDIYKEELINEKEHVIKSWRK